MRDLFHEKVPDKYIEQVCEVMYVLIERGRLLMFTMPDAALYTDVSLLLVPVVVALVFGTSGFNHLKSPRERAASIGIPLPFTLIIGVAELVGAIGMVGGLLTRWVALGLILIMFGAIYKKVIEWKTGFWGGKKSMGWHYEVLFIAMLLVMFTSGGARFTLSK